MADKTLFEHMHRYEHEGQEKGDGVQFTRDSYKGRDYFTLRAVWLTPEGEVRWSTIKEDRNGKCWAALKIRPEAMRALGEALIAASEGKTPTTRSPEAKKPGHGQGRGFSSGQSTHPDPEPGDDDIPF